MLEKNNKIIVKANDSCQGKDVYSATSEKEAEEIIEKMFKEQKKELKAIRKQCDKDTYRQIVKDKVNSIIKQQESLEYRYIQCEQLKRLYKKEYEHNCKTKGEAYANMIIYSKTLFEYVPFDMEVQKMYEELMDKDNG